MKLTLEEIGKKLREFQPTYANIKLSDTELGNAYVKKYGSVTSPSKKSDSTNQLPTNQPSPSPTFASALGLIQKYFPKDQWQNALAVARGESGLNPKAIGDNYPIRGQTIPSYGVFQIRGLPGRPPKEQLLDPEFNIKYAASLYKAQGWRPWYNTSKKLKLL